MAATTPFTIGAGPACAYGACGTVSRSAGKGTPPIPPAGRPRFGGAFRWALHRSAVTGHG